MSDGITMNFKVHFTRGQQGQRLMHVGTKPPPAPVAGGRVPRIARLMALAIRFEDLVRRGEVADFAEIAELGQVTRARVSQIVNLLNLAPDLQEAILHLPLVAGERETVSERDLRAIAAEPDWERQREMWRRVCGP
ncbi:MAG: hypothetical protein KF902_07430 [Phycisphaeraceae bacterium]|nr:hypothetical protein [Phycisphaeraceae bacterium]